MKNKKQQLQKLKNERGLTLVELLAVIVILGIISTIAFVMIGNVIDNAKKDTQIANAQQLIASAKLYEASGEEFDGEIDYKKLKEKGFIEPITDPWSKKAIDDDKVAKVTKTDNEYKVTLEASDSKYDIESTEAEINQGRDTVYNQ